MRRVVHANIGDSKVHLLRLTGTMVIFGAGVGILDAVATIFRLMKKIEIARANLDFSLQVFQLPSYELTNEIVLGMFMNPIAMFLLWIALLCIGTMVYRSGRLFPLREN